MPQSLSRVHVHLIFSTKHREPLLQTLELREQLYAYMATILRDNVDSPAIIVGGVEDHVHALVSLSRNVAIDDSSIRLARLGGSVALSQMWA